MASEYGESTSAATDAASFECNICFELAQDPIVTLCGHLFCWPCLYKWLHVHAHSPECPVCKALVEEEKLVPLYGRGKTPSDPRSRSVPGINIPSRPTGQRPATAPAPDPNQFPHAANPWFMGGGAPVGGTRFGNYTFSAAIGGLGGLFPLLNFQVHGFPDAHAYGPAAGFPYGYANGFHGGHGHGHPPHAYQRQMSQGQQADVYLKALLILKTLWPVKDPLIHYVRYQGKAILASRGTHLLMNKWRYYFVNFWQYYFHFWSQPYRMHINSLLNYSFYFMGYLLRVLINPYAVNNQMLENSFLIDTVIKKFDTIIPIISLIGSLSKAKFCTFSGHPISKPIWADLSDFDIIDRFGRICRNLSHYYSGSSKKQSLYRIKYILRLSCARTLARKHKSTARALLQRLGSGLLEEFFTEEEQVLSFIFPKTTLFTLHGSHRERIWSLDIIRINDLVNN